MTSRPILFSAPMVRAILAGTKTQTRRVVKPQPSQGLSFVGRICCSTHKDDEGKYSFADRHPCSRQVERIRCPYGQPGDQLWVRETWRTSRSLDHVKPSMLAPGAPIQYEADQWNEGFGLLDKGSIRQSIFMCRWMSRITLEITGIRVERLHDISEADARAEGCTGDCPVGYIPAYQAGPCSYEYAQLWESINDAGSWAANPFVWVITFKRL
jgi:hypothetical protein